jgi:hypothetical protein
VGLDFLAFLDCFVIPLTADSLLEESRESAARRSSGRSVWPKGGQFVLHAKALHGNPYDGHTLGPVIADLETLTGVAVHRIRGDKGYRGHNYPDSVQGLDQRPGRRP